MAKKKTPNPTASPSAPRRRTPRKTEAVPPADLSGLHAEQPRAEASDSAPPAAPGSGPSYDQIAEAAYHRYLNRGASDGRDFEDWLEAERELRSRR